MRRTFHDDRDLPEEKLASLLTFLVVGVFFVLMLVTRVVIASLLPVFLAIWAFWRRAPLAPIALVLSLCLLFFGLSRF